MKNFSLKILLFPTFAVPPLGERGVIFIFEIEIQMCEYKQKSADFKPKNFLKNIY